MSIRVGTHQVEEFVRKRNSWDHSRWMGQPFSLRAALEILDPEERFASSVAVPKQARPGVAGLVQLPFFSQEIGAGGVGSSRRKALVGSPGGEGIVFSPLDGLAKGRPRCLRCSVFRNEGEELSSDL